MKTVSIHDAKTNLSKYIAAAKQGEAIYIGSYGKPEVVLSIVPTAKNPKRKLGVGKDKLWAAPDAFTKKVDEEIAREMYGEN